MAMRIKATELPSVPITLDMERHIRMDFNAMALFQDTTGKNLLTVFPKPKLGEDGKPLPDGQQGDVFIDWSGIRSAVWAGLHWEDQSLTPEDVGVLMSMAPIDMIVRKIVESIDLCMPGLLPKPAEAPA